MKIIVDAMGGDNAPASNVRGALAAVKELGVEVILVGQGEEILKVLKEDGIGDLPPGLEIAHASQVVEMCDNPATAFREKKDSSLTVGLNLLTSGGGDAFVSAGSTGALLSAATLMIKRIRASAGRPWPRWYPPERAERCSLTAAPPQRVRRNTCCNSPLWAPTMPSGCSSARSPGWAC